MTSTQQAAETLAFDDVVLDVDTSTDSAGKETTFNLGPSLDWIRAYQNDNQQSQQLKVA